MIHPIRYYGDPVLRQVARPVERFDASLRRLVDDMLETMYAANGVGLAAPQIGVPWRVFIALETKPADESSEHGQVVDPSEWTRAEKKERWGVVAEHAMINPEIVERRGTQHGQDGCLSLPGLFVDEMERDRWVRVRYRDASGAERELEAEGHFAHVIQHELDHLDGVLFLDRLPAAERKAFMNEHRSELAEMQRAAKALLRDLERNAASG